MIYQMNDGANEMHKCPPRVANGAYGHHALVSGNAQRLVELTYDPYQHIFDAELDWLMADLFNVDHVEITNDEVHVNW